MTKKLYHNFEKLILEFMGGKSYRPMEQSDIFKQLCIPDEHSALCKQIFTDLLLNGKVEVKKKKFAIPFKGPHVLEGIFRMHPRGFGFVKPSSPNAPFDEVFIPKHLTDTAVDGDCVEVEVERDVEWTKGPDGKIIAIISRGHTLLGGTILQRDKMRGQTIAFAPLLGAAKPMIVKGKKSTEVKVGDRVILHVNDWGDRQRPPTCEIEEVCGHISDPSLDTVSAIKEFALRDPFPEAAVAEAKAYGTAVSAQDHKGRKDLTKLACITIDPETAKDFDDALSLTKDSKGHYHLGVHIADVAAYVKPGSALDDEAQKRANSTYFPGFCLPMIPSELSDHLCSLRPRVKRLTSSVLMTFDQDGKLLKTQIERSVIKSRCRFSYEEAKCVLDGEKSSTYKQTLHDMVDLCLLLKRQRNQRGSIDFALPDYIVEVDKQGRPLGMKVVPYDITHQLVEEFMLKANEVVAKHLLDQGKKPVLRIHEEPESENIEEFFTLARTLGFSLSKSPTQQEIQDLFYKAEKSPHAHRLAVSFIRSMKLAYYSQETVGHYGLALEHYCHFTSPIRRYSDLIIERLLFDEDVETEKIQEIAKHCSDQERLSFRAEMHVKQLKKLRLLKDYFENDPHRYYNAVVTKIKPFGLFFEVQDLMLEGFLHISELGSDFFIFNPRSNCLSGDRTGVRFDLGDALVVRPCTIDLILMETTWELESRKTKPRRKPTSPQKRHKRPRR